MAYGNVNLWPLKIAKAVHSSASEVEKRGRRHTTCLSATIEHQRGNIIHLPLSTYSAESPAKITQIQLKTKIAKHRRKQHLPHYNIANIKKQFFSTFFTTCQWLKNDLRISYWFKLFVEPDMQIFICLAIILFQQLLLVNFEYFNSHYLKLWIAKKSN